MDSHKSLSYIDILDDGNIYIQAGNSSTPITNIGKNTSGKFQPHVDKVGDLTIIYPYLFIAGYIPARFKSLDEFLYAFEQQSVDNKYIHNYINIASEQIFLFLNRNGIIDSNTLFFGVNKDSNTTTQFLKYLTSEIPEQAYNGVIYLKEDFDEGDLSVDENAPDDIKEKLEDLLYQADRPDRTFTFEDLDLEPDLLKYINGFVSIDEKVMGSITKDNTIVLVGDFFSNKSLIVEAYRKLKKLGYTVLFAVVIGSKK